MPGAEGRGNGEMGDWESDLFVNLDHFKRGNDTLEHGAGDDLLRVVSRGSPATLATIDTEDPARWEQAAIGPSSML